MTSKELKNLLPNDDRPVHISNEGFYEWYGTEVLKKEALLVLKEGVYIDFSNTTSHYKNPEQNEDSPRSMPKIPVEHQEHPAYPVLEKALKDWEILGGPGPDNFKLALVSSETNCFDWLRARGFDLPSVIDYLIESLKEADLLKDAQEANQT